NSYGQTHEIPNLYVAGPGIFTTAGASNPTYTILALSLRGAEQLAAHWSTVAGGNRKMGNGSPLPARKCQLARLEARQQLDRVLPLHAPLIARCATPRR